jgi:hypothetical protein
VRKVPVQYLLLRFRSHVCHMSRLATSPSRANNLQSVRLPPPLSSSLPAAALGWSAFNPTTISLPTLASRQQQKALQWARTFRVWLGMHLPWWPSSSTSFLPGALACVRSGTAAGWKFGS